MKHRFLVRLYIIICTALMILYVPLQSAMTSQVLLSRSTVAPEMSAEDVYMILRSGPWYNQSDPADDLGRRELVAQLLKVARAPLDSIEGGMILCLERGEAMGCRTKDLERNFGILNRLVFAVPRRMMDPLVSFPGGGFELKPVSLQSSGPAPTHVMEFRHFRKTFERRVHSSSNTD